MVLGLGDRAGGWKRGGVGGGLRGVGGKNENYVSDGQKDNDVRSTAYKCLLLWPIVIYYILDVEFFQQGLRCMIFTVLSLFSIIILL